ncbi:hypothetical protein RYZ26_04140 [Terasakiella sp. A23]|uniref:hypothetical protein n=1 Tax=Terasakiella sp. FCG-A23 TaxID=3080561 RepID=UPI0029539133|nr:hypothetical protein [Terasakiella sp. A23]MDV7338771.1 hypothetical protein [Terasakiella sp. A23]
MGSTNTIIAVGLDNLGKESGLVGLGALFTAFSPIPGTPAENQKKMLGYLKEIESQVLEIIAGIEELEKEIEALQEEVKKVEAANQYTKIITAYNTIMALSTKDLDESSLDQSLADMAKSLADPTSGIVEICAELNTFITSNAIDGKGVIQYVSENNNNGTAFSYLQSVKSITIDYGLAYYKALVCVNWLTMISNAQIYKFELTNFSLGEINGFFTNLNDTYTTYVPTTLQNLFQDMCAFNYTGTPPHATYDQDGAWPTSPQGVNINISAPNLGDSGYVKVETDFQSGYWLTLAANASKSSATTFQLVPINPPLNGSPTQDIHFALFCNSVSGIKPPYKGCPVFAGLSGTDGTSGEYEAVNMMTSWDPDKVDKQKGALPARFYLYFLPDGKGSGTFSFRWYRCFFTSPQQPVSADSGFYKYGFSTTKQFHTNVLSTVKPDDFDPSKSSQQFQITIVD